MTATAEGVGRCTECRTTYDCSFVGRVAIRSCPECGHSFRLLEQPTGLTTLPRNLEIPHEITAPIPALVVEPEPPAVDPYEGVKVWLLPKDHPRYLAWYEGQREKGRRAANARWSGHLLPVKPKRRHVHVSQLPKDDPAYQRWYAATLAGIRERDGVRLPVPSDLLAARRAALAKGGAL